MDKFKEWDDGRIKELRLGKISNDVGQELVFENSKIKVWNSVLQANQRLPFHRHSNNYIWTCLRVGKAVSHFEDGTIKSISYNKGDQSFYNHDEENDFIHDLENIGDTELEFITVEFLN